MSVAGFYTEDEPLKDGLDLSPMHITLKVGVKKKPKQRKKHLLKVLILHC